MHGEKSMITHHEAGHAIAALMTVQARVAAVGPITAPPVSPN
jgi:hypothetical protein